MNDIVRRLHEMAAASPEAGSVDSPRWDLAAQTWMAHIPAGLREVWGGLPEEARLVAVILGIELLREGHR